MENTDSRDQNKETAGASGRGGSTVDDDPVEREIQAQINLSDIDPLLRPLRLKFVFQLGDYLYSRWNEKNDQADLERSVLLLADCVENGEEFDVRTNVLLYLALWELCDTIKEIELVKKCEPACGVTFAYLLETSTYNKATQELLFMFASFQ